MHETNDAPVDIGQMISWIAGGETPAESWKIGTEHEKFLFHRQDHAPVVYEGEAGVGALLTFDNDDLPPHIVSVDPPAGQVDVATLVTLGGYNFAPAAAGLLQCAFGWRRVPATFVDFQHVRCAAPTASRSALPLEAWALVCRRTARDTPVCGPLGSRGAVPRSWGWSRSGTTCGMA